MRRQMERRGHTHRDRTADEVETDARAPAPTDDLKHELDELLEEIDGLLEENAEEFVSAYEQKGGQ